MTEHGERRGGSTSGLSTVVATGGWPEELLDAVEKALGANIAGVDAAYLAKEPRAFPRLVGDQLHPWLLLGSGLSDEEAMAVADSAYAAVPTLRLAMIGPECDPTRTATWLRRGCNVYLAQNVTADRFTAAVTLAATELVVVDKRCREPRDGQGEAAPELSTREREVLGLLCAGLGNNDMANCLHVSRRTVEFHLTRIFGKLGVSNRVEAALHAYAAGL